MVNGKMAAGFVTWLCNAAEQRCGFTSKELLNAALLDLEDLSDPSALIPMEAVADLWRFLLARTGDPGIGLRLAGPRDLRTQGFWGYALLSSLTLRQRFELHARYQSLRSSISLSFWEEGGEGVAEFGVHDVPADVYPALVDCCVATGLHQLRGHLHPRTPAVGLWLTYAEQPHHEGLRALAGGPIVFRAPCNRLQLPAAELDVKLPGDPYLGELMRAELDAELTQTEVADRQLSVLEMVRARLLARLPQDPSLARIARDLRMGVRTLQRQLEGAGASFQELLEDVRRTQAVQYLVGSDEAIERIATRVGYGDPSNFRRAFRRWTGTGPSAFRAEHRVAARPDVTSDDRQQARKASPL